MPDTKICGYCLQPYIVKRDSHYSASKFCSRRCAAHWRIDNRDLKRGGIVISECAQCGHEFGHWRHEPKKFCGNDCKFKYQRIHPTNDHGKKQTAHCVICGTQFSYWPSVRPDAQYCSYRCKASDHGNKVSGILSGNWKGNSRGAMSCRTLARHYLPNECAICGWAESSCDSHHIILAKYNGPNALGNMILLCPNHHRLVHKGLISVDDLIAVWHNAYDRLELDQSLIG